MKIKTYIIDAFTDKPFKGNPAGVCLLDNAIDDETMQSIASELNLSETAFLLQNESIKTEFSIRYFTPTVEIAFCGHATLASSKLVLNKLGLSEVTFTTDHGLKLSATTEGKMIVMKFPLYDTVSHERNQALLDTFGITNPLAIRYSPALKMLLVEIKDAQTLSSLKPDYQKALTVATLNNLIVTTRSPDKQYDFYSRCFCPWIGINEDPVTGASHAVLAKYWGDKLNKKEMTAYQLSKRGGFLHLKITGITELEVSGEAQIVFEGLFEV